MKGHRRVRGVPELHDELKTRVNLALTPTGVKGLDSLASDLNLSRSELVERIGRRLIPIANFPSVPLGDRNTLPNHPAIYLLIDGDRILYIGQSADLKQELLDNPYLQELEGNSNLRIAWIECNDANLLSTVEKALTEIFKSCLQTNLNEGEKVVSSSPKNIPTISINIPVDFMAQLLAVRTTLNNKASISGEQSNSHLNEENTNLAADSKKNSLIALINNIQQFMREWDANTHVQDY